MGSLQSEETPIDRAIIEEVIELTPETWRAIILDVEYSVENGVERYSHAISSADGGTEAVFPSEKLFAATHDLGTLFRRHGKHWRHVRYEVLLQLDNTWKYTVDFQY